MARLLAAESVLLGRLSSYTIGKELHRATDEGAIYLARNLSGEKCIVKSIRGHWHLGNEAKILKRYQPETRFIRPLIDEIQTPADPPSIIARCILEALRVLHKDGMAHTDIKLDNVFVNYGSGGGQRFSEIQLGDFGGTVSQDSEFSQNGALIGAGYTRSPEATLQLHWKTSTDIWSFGVALLDLIFGGGYHLLNPMVDKIPPGHDDYELTVLRRTYKFFGPFPQTYDDFKREDVLTIIQWIHAHGPPEKPFHRATPKEVPPADLAFILKIMKLDPRDRPTAEELR
ncbi:kinase-like protein [Rhypophila decipiens]|uniref:Kinase-like protein n=1 Tax=Rhypophila decipiens TaxID=261697 RepID=A0AAN6XZD7_9PEZI|nr:kinase-like protein [Rhypophila decipiens]